MTSELAMLGLSVVLGLVQIIAGAHFASAQRGYRYAASPRDEAMPPLHGVAGRLERALKNFLETFPLFAAAVVIAHLAGCHSATTVWGARLYLAARVAYVPLYAFGVPLVRSLVWNVAFAGIVLLLVAPL
jgi:uncharacterized MAPEG superfamily protein